MDFEGILASTPHNVHYMQRYIRCIRAWTNQELDQETYLERHHVCPKAMFPEYRDGRKHAWNIVPLTHRQHFLAHWMLWKAYENRSMAYAFMTMFIKNEKHIGRVKINMTGRLYEKAKRNASPRGIPKSLETKQKLSRAAKERYARGRVMTKEGRARLSHYARNRPLEVRERIGAKHRGKIISAETRQKQSVAFSGERNPRALTWVVHYEDGRPSEIIKSLKSWCRDRSIKYTTIYMRIRKGYVEFADGMRIEPFPA